MQAAASRETEPDTPPDVPRESVPFESDTPFELVPLSRMRRTIATRLAEAKRTIPHFYLRVECEIDRLLELRGRFNTGEHRISVNDFVVRAAALALVEVPEANVSFREDALVQYQRADVAVAVATEGGLLTPIVREADRKELTVLSQELRELAARAREGRLAPGSTRAAASRSRTSACTASRASTPSSIRRRAASSVWAPACSGRWFGTGAWPWGP